MAYYLVKARLIALLTRELKQKLFSNEFEKLQPFGKALTYSLKRSKRTGEELIMWEEEDYCTPPLAQERAAVLDRYFEIVSIEKVGLSEGWKTITGFPDLF